MKEILESEYKAAKKLVEQYEKQIKCECKNTIPVVEYNTYPYGESYSYDKCKDCGKWLNFTTL